jgi:CheY-like chemotaxis protein
MFNFEAQRSFPPVLLIDDDMVSREVMATVLTMSGFNVHTAAGGTAALDLLASRQCVPGVILMDAQMPGLSGIPLIKALRARTDARVYAISASDAPDDVADASDGFLLKPLEPGALRRLLEEDSALPSRDLQTASANLELAFDEPVVHAETLAQLRQIMPDAAVRQIYSAIVADLAKRLPMLQVAIAQGDAAEIRRIGHAIKGGCGMAGARQAARLGAVLESGALDSGPPQAGPRRTGVPGDRRPMEATAASRHGGDGTLSQGRNRNHLDNNLPVLADLHTATLNLARMLEVEFPA